MNSESILMIILFLNIVYLTYNVLTLRNTIKVDNSRYETDQNNLYIFGIVYLGISILLFLYHLISVKVNFKI
jgi:hypothetical protein